MMAGLPRRFKMEVREVKLDTVKKQLDIEWVNLMQEAKAIGLTTKEVQHFLQNLRKSRSPKR